MPPLEMTARDESEDLEFAGCEWRETFGARVVGERSVDELLDQAAGDRGGEECVAGGDCADGIGELLGRHVLEHEATGAGGHRVVDVLVQLEGRQDQHADRGQLVCDAPSRLDPVGLRHPDVRQDHLG